MSILNCKANDEAMFDKSLSGKALAAGSLNRKNRRLSPCRLGLQDSYFSNHAYLVQGYGDFQEIDGGLLVAKDCGESSVSDAAGFLPKDVGEFRSHRDAKHRP